MCNYQAGYEGKNSLASGTLCLWVARMTRFGMRPEDFQEVAQLMRDAIVEQKNIKQEVIRLRQRFIKMNYFFIGDEFENALSQMIRSLS